MKDLLGVSERELQEVIRTAVKAGLASLAPKPEPVLHLSAEERERVVEHLLRTHGGAMYSRYQNQHMDRQQRADAYAAAVTGNVIGMADLRGCGVAVAADGSSLGAPHAFSVHGLAADDPAIVAMMPKPSFKRRIE